MENFPIVDSRRSKIDEFLLNDNQVTSIGGNNILPGYQHHLGGIHHRHANSKGRDDVRSMTGSLQSQVHHRPCFKYCLVITYL